jgi:hypothetical protein
MSKPFYLAAIVAGVLFIAGTPGYGGLARAVDCSGSGPESTSYSGRTSSATVYELNYCSDPTLMLSVDLQWSNARKDLALKITDPLGVVHTADMRGTSEHYLARAPLAEGSWTVEVVNKSSGSVTYGLTISFVPDPSA